MAKKHKLTKKTDHIDGFSGKDLFLAPMLTVNGVEKATLSNKDVLNGRGGIDTINAFISADALKPILKNIERAVFTRHDTDALALDLAKSAKLSNIQLKNFDCDVDIAHAGRLSNFTLQNANNITTTRNFSIDGIDADKVEKLALNIVNVGNQANDNFGYLALSSGSIFAEMAIKLKAGAVILQGDHGAEALAIHSIAGAYANALETKMDPAKDATKSIVIDGGGALSYYRSNLDGNNFSSATLESFDASAMTGDLTAHFGGDNLVSVKTGSGSDEIYLSGLGGASGAKAMIALGDGDDYINLRSIGKAVDPASLAIDGGNGHDRFSFNGALADVASVLQNFETLYVQEATGTYDLAGSGITYFDLYGPQSAVTLDHAASGMRLDLNDTSTQSVTVHVDNAAGSDTDSLMLSLYSGAFGDFFQGFNAPDLSKLAIYSYGSAVNTLYLGTLGATNDAAAITIGGNQSLTLKSALGSRNISEITINSSAGVDLYDLRDHSVGIYGTVKSFAASGATITGGAGNDVLAGGSGNDKINSGGGNDVIHASQGWDVFTFADGNETLVYADADFSVANSEDRINNFGLLDTIDISALVSSVKLVRVNSSAEGTAALSTTEVVAYYNLQSHRLRVDIDHDGVFESSDLQIYLPENELFNQWNLVA